MRRFLLGVVTGVLVVALALVALVVAASEPGGTASPVPSPSDAAAAAPPPPRDLGRDETWLDAVELDSASVVTPDGGFRDLHATGRDVRMTAQGLRAGQLRIEATLPFDAAARQVGGDVQLYAAGGGRAGVRRTASLLGRTVTVRATGTVTARDGRLVIEPQTVDLGGPGWLDAGLSAAARQVVTIQHTVQGLPDGMRLTRVTVVDSGFRAHLEGSDVSLSRVTR
jgi:hypothetical protein